MATQFALLPVNALQTGQYQPRQDFNKTALAELAQSIATQGLIEPLIVREIAKGRYELIAGERRWRAAQIAGLTEVPCLIGQYSDKQACALALIENIQRENLNLIEEATGYKRLVDEFSYQQDELAILMGKSRSHIANIMRLLTLSEAIKELIRDKLLSQGHARTLIGLTPDEQEFFAHQALDEQWSVRALEQAIRSHKSTLLTLPKNPKTDRDVARLQLILAEQLGAPVQIVNESDRGGWLKVKFFDNDTLAGLLERLGLRYD